MRKDCHKPSYYSWRAFRNRCNSDKMYNYAKYGGSGMTYDSRWDSYDIFLEEMGQRPDGKTLDRIDNTKGYYKENCRWATPSEQQSNRSCTLWIEYNGELKTAKEWAIDLGLAPGAVWNRIKLLKWDIEKAVTTRKAG